jgi:aldehyde:ferredoxin oxidoreductase
MDSRHGVEERLIDMSFSSVPGFHGKILDVDLTKGDVVEKPLDPDLAGDYLGGRGLAARIFYDAVDPACDPLGPDNVLVIAASPLIGTNAPTAGRGHMVFKSPLTGVMGTSNSGGTWGAAFKASGYDALVIRGASFEPVMLDIRPGKAELRPASHLWGKGVHETTALLESEAAPGKPLKTLCIGPAGENRVRFAAVVNDRNRVYGRGGAGAVFGAKNLKAIRVAGAEKTALRDAEAYASGYNQARDLLKQAPVTKRILRELGTAGLVELINLIDMLPRRNFQDCVHRDEDVARISGETLARTILERAGGCRLCPIGCQRHTRVPGRNGCEQKGEGPEYETVVLMGPVCDIYDLEAITRANYRCNELGLDTISYGGTLACAMELSENGLLDNAPDSDQALRFGSADALENLVRMTALRQGLGARLADGSYRLAESCGRPDLSMTVKRLEIPAYDPRASYTQALGYATSPSGACHLRGGYAVSLAFFGGAREIPRFSRLQSPIAIRNMQNIGIIQDSLGICRFTGYAFSVDPWARMLGGVLGRRVSVSELEEAANRIASLERLFNCEAGATSADDVLPPRFADEPILVAGKERRISREDMEAMKAEYYKARGWDVEGRPTPKSLAALRIMGRKR